MILTGTIESSRANRNHRVLPNGAGFWRSELITVEDGPQVFLVEQEPHTVVLPHFHLQDEFQVIVGGDGTLGRQPVRPITVHYASRHTGYGPIAAGKDGVAYMTLRAKLDLGAHWLPESRHRMENLPKRSLHGKSFDVSNDAALRSRAESSLDALIAPQADGVAAWLVRTPPGEPVDAPAQKGVRFYVVVAGEMRLTGERLVRGAATFVSAEREFAATAGDAGLEVLILQFAGL
ncbi:MAG: hypothetical protein A3G81_33670 [Betaproteobacteria bacterium RIFCSPLOWO2_12_FULL_65_14]|nr:MAG: hypothetical protein A3G81_33670 [Betaproteobacteria bacterium RIFCSPLOWO2_12_FULL_65_14]